MTKVEAVVTRERVETVIDAVEHETGHVGVTVMGAVGFGLEFGDGDAVIGTYGFFPSATSLLGVGKAPYSFFTGIPGATGYLFEVVFAGVSLAIVWGAMAERAKLWVYFAFGVAFTLVYSVTSH